MVDRSDGNSRSAGSGSDGEVSSSLGGYSADREGASPSSHMNMHKRSFASEGHKRDKRRKFDEEQYAAYVTKADLARAGVRVRPIDTKRSRVALGKVDISRVTLVRSKEVESSPFLVPKAMAQVKYDFAAESVYSALVDSCRRVYELLDAVDSDDSTSFYSDAESDDSQGSVKNPVLIPRIDDSIPTTVARYSPSLVEQEVPPAHAVSMTMEEALTVRDCSRYVPNSLSDLALILNDVR